MFFLSFMQLENWEVSSLLLSFACIWIWLEICSLCRSFPWGEEQARKEKRGIQCRYLSLWFFWLLDLVSRPPKKKKNPLLIICFFERLLKQTILFCLITLNFREASCWKIPSISFQWPICSYLFFLSSVLTFLSVVDPE
jgi:hypothetical protein